VLWYAHYNNACLLVRMIMLMGYVKRRTSLNVSYAQVQAIIDTTSFTPQSTTHIMQPSRVQVHQYLTQSCTTPGSHNQAFNLALCRSSFASFNKKLSHASVNHLTQPQHSRGYSLIPPNCWSDSTQMPQSMGIEHTPPRREIEQLQTHRQYDPCNNQTGPSGPQTANLPVSHDTESCPQDVLNYTYSHVRSHVVSVVEAHKRQVRYVCNVHRCTQQRPDSKQRRRLAAASERIVPIESEDADGCIEQAIHHTQTRGEVVQLLGDIEVTRVENHAEDPAREAAVSEPNVVFAQCVAGRHFSLQLRHSPVVCEEVEQREQHACWLLNA
jgi:hypothetical protein